MFSRGELVATQIRLERKLQSKIDELKENPIETTFYKVLCSEIKSLSDDLLKVSFEIDKTEIALKDAKDTSK